MPDGRVAAHLATCPNCAAALVSARSLEADAAAPRRAGARRRSSPRARWRASAARDGAATSSSTSDSTSRSASSSLAVVGGVWLLLHRSGLAVGQQRGGRSVRHRVRDASPGASRRRCRSTPARRRARHARWPSGGGRSGMRRSALRIADCGLRIRLSNVECGSGIRDEDRSTLRNPQSTSIRTLHPHRINPQSALRNPQCPSVTEVGRRQASAAAAAAALLPSRIQPLHRAVFRQRRRLLRSARRRTAATIATVVLIDSNADLIGCYETVRDAPDEVARRAGAAGRGARARRPRAVLRACATGSSTRSAIACGDRTATSPIRRRSRRC